MKPSRLLRFAAAVCVLGGIALLQPSPAQAASSTPDPFCARCVDYNACGFEEMLCDLWGCGTAGMASCGELGTCSINKSIVVCNSEPE